MPNLIAQKQAIDKQIAEAKPQAVAEVKRFMELMGVTPADMGLQPIAVARPPAAKRKVKYADAHGNTWTGVGQRPRWLAHALANGAELDQFKVQG